MSFSDSIHVFQYIFIVQVLALKMISRALLPFACPERNMSDIPGYTRHIKSSMQLPAEASSQAHIHRVKTRLLTI